MLQHEYELFFLPPFNISGTTIPQCIIGQQEVTSQEVTPITVIYYTKPLKNLFYMSHIIKNPCLTLQLDYY